MSHFTVLVVGDNAEEQLAPYDENIEVEPYGEDWGDEDIALFEEHVMKVSGDLDTVLAKMREWNGCKNTYDSERDVYVRWTTYNPKSQWDWYEVGGRWEGFFKLTGEDRWVDSAYKGEIDFEGMKQQDIEPLTFAYVKDGEWHERAQMGWFAVTSNERPEGEWEKEFKDMLDSLPDDTLLTLFDCHI